MLISTAQYQLAISWKYLRFASRQMLSNSVFINLCNYITETFKHVLCVLRTALTDVPTPNPRPFQTLTNQSILIRNRGTNGQASGRESPAGLCGNLISHLLQYRNVLSFSGQNLAGFSRLPTSDDSYVLAENQVNNTVLL